MAKGLNRKERSSLDKYKPAEIPTKTINKYQRESVKTPKKYLEKQVKRYVMASPDTGQYLVVVPGKHQYMFTNNIIKATKCQSTFDAKTVIRDYHLETGDNFDLVVIPLEITYELINETIDSTLSDESYWEDVSNWKNLN